VQGNDMAKHRSSLQGTVAKTGDLSRSRRAQLVAEFEGDLGIDYKARAKIAADEQRWQTIKTVIVWTIALMFFAIACQKLWVMGQKVDKPFSEISPVSEWL
jgi:hypothetical protein